ncbi:Mitochondrial distribution and morphology protein 35 [Erysiphe necator]|nr:Mitochondrial distribution and morphology protein 35 [Erysiphe necator]
MSASLAPQCNESKERYDSCFLKWYSEKYLRGNVMKDDCAPLFEEYKACLSNILKDRGIDKMLDSAREDHKENDTLYKQKFKFQSAAFLFINLTSY